MIVEQSISLDLQRQGMPVVVYAKQYDEDTRVLRIALFSNGVRYEIPDGVAAHFSCKKADGNVVMFPCPVENNEIVVTLSKQSLACDGESVADVFLTKDGKVLSSCNFTIRVYRAPVQDDDVVESAEELTSLKNAIAEVGNAQETANEALEKAQEAVDLIGDANSLNERLTVVERKIENIDAALEGDVYADSVLSDVGYEIELPANALPWMHTDRIGCASSRNFESILDFSTITPQTQNGITVSCNAESGVFTINGTATADVSIRFDGSFGTSGSAVDKVVLLEKIGGSVSGGGENDVFGIGNASAMGVASMLFMGERLEQGWAVNSENQSKNEIGYIYLGISTGATFANYQIYVGVANAENAWSLVENKPTALVTKGEDGDTISTTDLPDLSELDDWGQGVPSVGGNYIEFTEDGRVLYQRTSKRIVLTGASPRIFYNNSVYGKKCVVAYLNDEPAVNDSTLVLTVCNDFNSMSNNEAYFLPVGSDAVVFCYDKNLKIYKPEFDSIDDPAATFNAECAARYADGEGTNPIVIEYALAELPDPIDITDRFNWDGFIEGQGNGSVIIENEHKAALPIQLTYEEVLE